VLGNLTGATQGVQTRSYAYDGLGRMTSETNPESGTWTYRYDTQTSACYSGAYAGDLNQMTDATGNTVCFYYDGLHRLTDVGYGSSNTLCKRFRYDNTAPPSGITVANGMGRLVKASTDNCGVGGPWTNFTDDWFSYDAKGEITDVWQSSPNSGGYWHANASYYANGAFNVLSGSDGYWMDFSLDGEGRIYSSLNGALTSSTSYNAADQVTGVTLGSGDSEGFF
jgi:YD repeat-containing protein